MEPMKNNIFNIWKINCSTSSLFYSF